MEASFEKGEYRHVRKFDFTALTYSATVPSVLRILASNGHMIRGLHRSLKATSYCGGRAHPPSESPLKGAVLNIERTNRKARILSSHPRSSGTDAR